LDLADPKDARLLMQRCCTNIFLAGALVDGLEVVKAYNGLHRLNAVTAHVTQHALECCRVRVALHNGSAASAHSPLTLQHKSHVTRVCQVLSQVLDGTLFATRSTSSTSTSTSSSTTTNTTNTSSAGRATMNGLKDVLSIAREVVVLLLATEGGLFAARVLVRWVMAQMAQVRAASCGDGRGGGGGGGGGGLAVCRGRVVDYYINQGLVEKINRMIILEQEFHVLVPAEFSIEQLSSAPRGSSGGSGGSGGGGGGGAKGEQARFR
jgi:hypothetical protein